MTKDLDELKSLEEKLFRKRLKLTKLRKSPRWEIEDLQKVLKNLKNNKSRDPHWFVNEIFKPGVIRKYLEKSLLLLLNRVKDKLEIPSPMEFANITYLYK